MTDLLTTMRRLWESACKDTPQRPSCTIQDGEFVLTINGNRPMWVEMLSVAGVPANAGQTVTGDTLTVRWRSWADHIFGDDGLLAQRLPNYEMRPEQLHMARLVQRSIEMNDAAIIEAGTGVGKSYAYAAVAMAMNKKIVISTSNKALQMQLYRKDIPFLQSVFPGKRVALVQGKSNYACRYRAEDPMSGRLTFDDAPLADWYASTQSGNVEEIPFAADWKTLASITANDECIGKMCPFYDSCFYYKAKAERDQADVLICNHMLLALNQMYPGAGILPKPDVIVVDEAHQFANYVQNASGVELKLPGIEKRIERSAKYSEDAQSVDDTIAALRTFNRAISDLIAPTSEYQVTITKETVIAAGIELASCLNELSDTIWLDDEMPSSREEKTQANAANRLRTLADEIAALSSETQPGHVRWMDISGDIVLNNTPFDVSEFIGRLAGYLKHSDEPTDRHTHCARCGRKLVASIVNILDGQPYGPDCIRQADPFGDAEQISLEEWLATDRPADNGPRQDFDRVPVIFTSATIAAPDFAHFMRQSGIPDALQMQLGSPFDYAKNAMLYVPNGASPTPDSRDYQPWLVDEIRRLVLASDGGAFCLFTSYANMTYAANALRAEFARAGLTIYQQGQLPKLEIAKRFAESERNVLFATKSFFEGVSIEGSALRLVIVDKMPFEAPNPINTAQEAAIVEWAKEQGVRDPQWLPFDTLRLPKMILELKQGSGRLIRTARDWGVIAILDARLRSKPYGRQKVLPALPPAKLTHSAFVAGQFLIERRFKPVPVTLRPVAIQSAHAVEMEF
jgi:ATP-dependent DNA helicase DinG